MRYILTLLIILWTDTVLRADVAIKMLNKLDSEPKIDTN